MEKRITFVGLDAHKVSTNVSVIRGAERPIEWQVSTERGSIRKMVKKVLTQAPGKVSFCYEAGPCGYALQRWIREMGVECMVVAPSLIPRKPGERIKTDRRDARKLAELLRAGLLTEVHPPSEADEAVRDLCRAREDAHEDLVRSRHRLSKLLLRRGLQWLGTKRAWSQGHRLWVRSLRFEHAADQVVLDDYLLAIEHVEERLRVLDAEIEEASQQAPYAEVVGALRCFRGIDTLTAMTLVAELHDFMRFGSARGLMSFLGLVPSEHSSGGKKQRGEITKAQSLRARREGQPAQTIAIADKAMRRLHRRFTHMLERGKPRQEVAVAIARELTGFIWAAMRQSQAA
jgi:transposase